MPGSLEISDFVCVRGQDASLHLSMMISHRWQRWRCVCPPGCVQWSWGKSCTCFQCRGLNAHGKSHCQLLMAELVTEERGDKRHRSTWVVEGQLVRLCIWSGRLVRFAYMGRTCSNRYGETRWLPRSSVETCVPDRSFLLEPRRCRPERGTARRWACERELLTKKDSALRSNERWQWGRYWMLITHLSYQIAFIVQCL